MFPRDRVIPETPGTTLGARRSASRCFRRPTVPPRTYSSPGARRWSDACSPDADAVNAEVPRAGRRRLEPFVAGWIEIIRRK